MPRQELYVLESMRKSLLLRGCEFALRVFDEHNLANEIVIDRHGEEALALLWEHRRDLAIQGITNLDKGEK